MIYSGQFEIVHMVVRHGSFTKAAEALNITPAAVSQQIKKLEDRLQMRLFHRTTRQVVPTEIGVQLGEALQTGKQNVMAVLETLEAGRDEPAGRLKMNVPMSYGELYLRKPIAHYAKRFPKVIVDVDFDDREIDVVAGGYDLVIRIGALPDSGLVARKVGDCPLILCASREFLAQHGTPDKLADISALPAIIYANTANALAWQCSDEHNRMRSVTLNPGLYANSAGMMLEACLAGVGLAILPIFSCADELADGRLQRVLPAFETAPARSIYAVYPDRRYLPMKTRAFIDMLFETAD
jgi:DNA-binding transcriptional LysR family regulator